MTVVFSFISVLAAWVVLYLDTFPILLNRWNSGDYSYCWLVVPLAAYVAWQRRSLLPESSRPAVKSGYLMLLFVAVLFFLGKASAVDALVFVSMWLCVVAVLLFVRGWKAMKAMFFPLLILAFAIPPPPFINRMLTFRLRLISSDLSVRIMQFIDIPVFREGNIIDLGMIKLHVVDACSGLRYLFPTVLLGIIMAYWFNSRAWQRFVVILATIPTAIASNAVRIAIVGYIARNISLETAENFFHDASGIVIYLLSIVMLVTLSLLLNLFDRGVKRADLADRTYYGQAATNAPLHLIIMAVFLAGMFVLYINAVAGRVVPERPSFESFPMTFSDFEGRREFFSEEIVESLGADDYLSGVFRDKVTGRDILLLVSYYDYQEPQRAAHNPISCLLGGGGWDLSSTTELAPDKAAGRPFKVERLILSKPGARLLALYWFQQRGRIITNEYLNKAYLALDSMSRQRTDGALVRIELMLADGETVENGQKILDRFINSFSSILAPYVPD
ncbi:VPLPA-CTERM-specific exosortase XrtD [Maridesulfovibrio sp.]|uniref:VPLPA-CTERM-specific exosortase XrtD n=1 Tax=Maridesulfovibrio sp. TaxID=2795000 RepID=UPI002A18DCCC|nr:VPLPA-CTERM-specific exosortase XrtD [Maridesulfovibrio sp.]